ncbi:MAG: hypothetical protein OXC28_22285 [Defluviicoccus sp.]|nr:hypothetical protein [Defluviicoccus sp.]
MEWSFWVLAAIAGIPLLSVIPLLISGVPSAYFVCNDEFYGTLYTACAHRYRVDLLTTVPVPDWWLFRAAMPVVQRGRREPGPPARGGSSAQGP